MSSQTRLDQLFENTPPPGAKRVAVVLGRFNPPTKGHYELISKVKSFIKAHPELMLEALPVVIVIGNDKKEKTPEQLIKNPLSVHERILFIKSSGHANGVTIMAAENAFGALTGLRAKDMEPIAVAAGTDRINDYIRILDEYFKDTNGRSIKHVKIHLSRDADAITSDRDEKENSIDDILDAMKDGDDPKIDAVSGSLARRAAELEYESEFYKIVGLETNPKLAKNLYNKVRSALLMGGKSQPSKEVK